MIIRIRGIPTETRHLALHVLAKRPLGETSLQNPSGSVFAISPSTQLSLAANGMADGHRKKWEKHEKPRTRVKRPTFLMATCRKWGLKLSNHLFFAFCFSRQNHTLLKRVYFGADTSLEIGGWNRGWAFRGNSNGYRGNRLGCFFNQQIEISQRKGEIFHNQGYDMFISSPRWVRIHPACGWWMPLQQPEVDPTVPQYFGASLWGGTVAWWEEHLCRGPIFSSKKHQTTRVLPERYHNLHPNWWNLIKQFNLGTDHPNLHPNFTRCFSIWEMMISFSWATTQHPSVYWSKRVRNLRLLRHLSLNELVFLSVFSNPQITIYIYMYR